MKFILLLLGLFSSLVVFSQLSLITTTEISTDKCTHVQSATATPQPNSSLVLVGRFPPRLSGDPYSTYRTLVEFPIGIPQNAIITSAKLKMYINTTVGSPTVYAARLSAPWDESTAVWSFQPAYETSDIITTSSIASNWMTFDVKNHVQKMRAGVYNNNGWILYLSNETQSVSVYRRFASDDEINSTLRPKLEITYYIPMSVASAAITHSSGLSISDGSINPVLADGPGGTYTYRWYNAAGALLSTNTSNPNLSNVSPGWYGLQVTSSVAGTDPFYYAFLVGANCSEVPIEFNPGPNYIDDALLFGPSLSTQAYNNYGTESVESALDLVFFGSPTENRTLIRFRLWVDPILNVTESDFVLKGLENSSSRSNVARLKRVTENWNENIVTHSSMPTSSSDILVNIPEMTSMTETKSINIIDFWGYWKQNNTLNYGFLFELQLYNGIHASQRYHSSDASAINRPKINFKVGIYDSECFSSYSEVKRKLDGGYSVVVNGKLKFTMNEEYQLSASKYLPFKIYDKNHVVMEESTINGVVLNGSIPPFPLNFNDNRWEINISSIPGMIVGEYYTLELLNSKGEKRYLRFLYNS